MQYINNKEFRQQTMREEVVLVCLQLFLVLTINMGINPTKVIYGNTFTKINRLSK